MVRVRARVRSSFGKRRQLPEWFSRARAPLTCCPSTPYWRSLLFTSTEAGLRSGRERKDHTPFGGAGETLGRGQTFGARKGLALGACKDVSFGVRLSSSRPTVFVKARQIAPALSAVRKRRRVNLAPIAEPYSTQGCSLTIRSP